MIRSVLSLRAADGNIDALEDFYAEHGILARAERFSGCREAVLLRASSGSLVTHLVIADWETAEDYDRWVQDPWRAAVSRQLTDLLDAEFDGPIVGGTFEFVPSR